MENEIRFEFKCDQDKLMSELFQQNLALQAQVTTLSSLFVSVISELKGKSTGDNILKVLNDQTKDMLFKLIEENEYLADPWKKYLKENLLKGLPGISLSDPDPDKE